jgi:hypothetical protein
MKNNPWNDSNWKTINLSQNRLFKGLSKENIVEYKYSPILFAGSCDAAGLRYEKYWHELYCEVKGINHKDYVVVGRPVCSFSSINRQLYVYLQKVDRTPKKLLMVVPISAHESVLEGTCYSITERPEPVNFINRLGLAPKSCVEIGYKLQEAYSSANSLDQKIYDFCKDFSFLEMMCKLYNIELFWTQNLTQSSQKHYGDINNFLDEHEFAKKTFIGHLPATEFDNAFDSPTADSHKKIAQLFLELKND